MPRNPSSTRTLSSTRNARSSVTPITSYRIPELYSNLGITRLWDWRTGFDGSKNPIVSNMMGRGCMNWRGSTAIASAFTTGQYSIELERTSTNDYLTTAPMALTNGMTSITIFAWFKQESAVGGQIRNFITHWETATGNFRGFMFRVNGSHQMELLLSSDGALGTQASYLTTETMTDTSAWHLIVGTYDTTNRGKIYLDKVAQTVGVTGSHPASINSSAIAVLIGATQPSTPSNFFDGTLGICGVAENKSMTAAEITQLYNFTNSIGRYV